MIQRKKLIILFSFVLMMMLLSNIFGVESFKPKYGLTTTKVNMRQAATTSSSIIRTVAKNTNLKMVGKQGSFYIVQLATNELGYIHVDYIKSTTTVPKAKVYTSYTPYTVYTYEPSTNIRLGPSTSFRKVATLSKNTKLTVFGKIDDFLAVQFDNNKVGMIKSSLVKKVTSSGENSQVTQVNKADLVIQYINEARIARNLPKLTKDSKLMEIAQLKTNEMQKQKYFSHTSPSYGSPFKMMQNFGITYKTAGENLAGNETMRGAVDSWIKSTQHAKNLFSTSYNYIGVGVSASEQYGYVVSAMFIGK